MTKRVDVLLVSVIFRNVVLVSFLVCLHFRENSGEKGLSFLAAQLLQPPCKADPDAEL